MALNQLFCKKPDLDILSILLDCFNLENINDTKIFTKRNLVEFKTVEKINKNKKKFEKYYLPCKSSKYLDNLNEKKVITILKQIVRIFDFYIYSKERVKDSEKYIVYQVVPLCQKNILNIKKKKSNICCIL